MFLKLFALSLLLVNNLHASLIFHEVFLSNSDLLEHFLDIKFRVNDLLLALDNLHVHVFFLAVYFFHLFLEVELVSLLLGLRFWGGIHLVRGF